MVARLGVYFLFFFMCKLHYMAGNRNFGRHSLVGVKVVLSEYGSRREIEDMHIPLLMKVIRVMEVLFLVSLYANRYLSAHSHLHIMESVMVLWASLPPALCTSSTLVPALSE